MTREFHRFTVNVGGGKLRREMLEGRMHMVADGAIIPDGVMNGSEGPVNYPHDQNVKSVSRWNHMPIVVYHPKVNEQYVSARDPTFLNTRKVGVILNTRHDGKVRTEFWFDEERTKEIDDRVYNALNEGAPIEVSTGLSAECDRVPGEKDGVKYIGTVSNYEPDHIAVLPDKTGAYSIAMGGGIFANEEQDYVYNRSFSENERKRLAKKGMAMSDGSFPIQTVQDLKNAIKAYGRAKDKEAAKRHIIRRARAMGLTHLLPSEWSVTANVTANEDTGLSYDQIRDMVCSALYDKFRQPGYSWSGYLMDVYDGYLVYCMSDGNGDRKCYRMDYTVSNGKVQLTGDPTEIVRVVQYQDVEDGSVVGNESGVPQVPFHKENGMAFDKKAHVNSLIGNGFEETDRSWLEALPENQLQKIQPKQTTPSPAAPVVNQAPPVQPAAPQLTQEQLLAVLGPQWLQVHNQGLKALANTKKQLIDTIKANPNNKFTDEYLNNVQDLDMLAGMAELAKANTPQAGNNMFNHGWDPWGVNNYAGAVGGVTPVHNNANDLEAPPEPPEMYPAEKKSA